MSVSARRVIPYIETGTRPFLCPTAIPVHNECYMVRNGTAPQRLRHSIPHAPPQQAPHNCAQVHGCYVSSIACCSIFSLLYEPPAVPLITPRPHGACARCRRGRQRPHGGRQPATTKILLGGVSVIILTSTPTRHPAGDMRRHSRHLFVAHTRERVVTTRTVMVVTGFCKFTLDPIYK
jgi:hypothetical protein